MLSVIFDMDGLMFDTERLNARGWTEAGRQHGWTITREILNETVGVNVPRACEIMTGHFGSDFDFYAIRKDRLEWSFNWIKEHGMPEKKGLRDLLTWLDEHSVKYALATSSERKLVNFYRENIAKPDFFDGFHAIVTGEQIKNGKPAPDIFLEAARQLDAEPCKCVVLEDSYNGIKAAHAANMIPIMVPDVLPPTQEILSLAHTRVDDLNQVIPVLEKLSQERV